ncbi:MAG: L,D-transpeptidase family protein [Thermoflexibacteraceae bacterium]|jgi:murein L,D-transpeptidase YafK
MLKYLLKITVVFCLFSIYSLNCFAQNKDLLTTQLKNSRVKTAQKEADGVLKALFANKNLPYPAEKVFMRVFKAESELELWAENPKNQQYVLVKTFPICFMSGTLGAKYEQGDFQVPEGFYEITYFNAQSNYYLSMLVNYPNQYDLFYKKTGGAICIHGACASIGCMPLEDDPVKEVYWLALQAYSKGNKVPVHIFPTKLNNKNWEKLYKDFENDTQKINFWKELQAGYDYFETKHQLPNIKVIKGKYVLE